MSILMLVCSGLVAGLFGSFPPGSANAEVRPYSPLSTRAAFYYELGARTCSRGGPLWLALFTLGIFAEVGRILSERLLFGSTKGMTAE